MSIRLTAIATAALLGLAACDDFATGRPLPPPPGPPAPPSPELPMTGAKARTIIDGLPLNCREMASLKAAMLLCEERQNRPADHAALRTELRDLKWTLQGLPREEASRRCAAITDELRLKPKPQVCWDLGED